LPLQSQALTDKVENIEQRLKQLEHSLNFQGNFRQVSKEVQRLSQQIESPEVKSSGKYDELKSHLIGVAAAVGIGLMAGNFTERGLNEVSMFSEISANVQLTSSIHSTDSSEAIQAPAIAGLTESFTEKALKKQSTLSERSVNVQGSFNVDALMRAIIGQESAGKFNAVNSDSGALGYGQVMPENVPSWSLESLGYTLTPEEFLQSPKLQLKIIRYKLEQAIAAQSKPGRDLQQVARRVAAVWYSGQGKLWNNTKPQFYNGQSYPSIAHYTQSVWEKYQKEVGINPASVVPQQKKTWGSGLLSFFNSAAAQQDVLATKVVEYMKKQGYKVSTHPKEVNIVHIRNGATAKNLFEDTRLVIQFDAAGRPRILGQWAETTKPGIQLIRRPVNAKGAIAIQPGQYQSWQVGLHFGMSGRHTHEALIQVRPIKGMRDSDRNTTFDTPDAGLFWVNIHQPWADGELVDDRSAGCMVTQTKAAHQEFMKIVKSDRRYRSDPGFIFTSTIIDSGDLL